METQTCDWQRASERSKKKYVYGCLRVYALCTLFISILRRWQKKISHTYNNTSTRIQLRRRWNVAHNTRKKKQKPINAMNRKRYLGHLNDLTIYIALFNVIYLDDFMVSAHARMHTHTHALSRSYTCIHWLAKSLFTITNKPIHL